MALAALKFEFSLKAYKKSDVSCFCFFNQTKKL